MSSNIRVCLFRIIRQIKRIIEDDRLQPRESDVEHFDIRQLKRVIKDNRNNHKNLVSLHQRLLQNDREWSELIIGNMAERRKKREFVRRHGDYLRLIEPCEMAIRKSLRLRDFSVATFRRRFPNTVLRFIIV